MSDEESRIENMESVSEEIEESVDLLNIWEKIKLKCESLSLEYSEITDIDPSYLAIAMPAGRNKRWVTVSSAEKASSLLRLDLKNYSFLEDLWAICSYKDKFIEAELGSNLLAPRSLLKRITGQKVINREDALVPLVIKNESEKSDLPKFVIGEASSEFRTLHFGERTARPITLRIENVNIDRHDDGVKLLQKYSDTIFFQIDALTNFNFTLERAISPMSLKGISSRSPVIDNIKYPSMEYKHSPASLYWYAKAATRLPLLQFLAFYQTVEYFFPVYSQIDAQKRLRQILKDPAFQIDDPDDLARLLYAVTANRNSGFGDERAQLKATILECISADDARRFLTSAPRRSEHYQNKALKIYHKIPIANQDADLRFDISDRIYDIRCRIVHTKNESKDAVRDYLLPFSKEAEQLTYDIDLVQYIARAVLINSSVNLRHQI